MIKIVKESIVKTHSYNLYGEDSVKTEFIEQYYYDSEEEKMSHKQSMESNGFHDSGQTKENVGSVDAPVYVWFGQYHKTKYNYTTSVLAYLNKMLRAGKKQTL